MAVAMLAVELCITLAHTSTQGKPVWIYALPYGIGYVGFLRKPLASQ